MYNYFIHVQFVHSFTVNLFISRMWLNSLYSYAGASLQRPRRRATPSRRCEEPGDDAYCGACVCVCVYTLLELIEPVFATFAFARNAQGSLQKRYVIFFPFTHTRTHTHTVFVCVFVTKLVANIWRWPFWSP